MTLSSAVRPADESIGGAPAGLIRSRDRVLEGDQFIQHERRLLSDAVDVHGESARYSGKREIHLLGIDGDRGEAAQTRRVGRGQDDLVVRVALEVVAGRRNGEGARITWERS